MIPIFAESYAMLSHAIVDGRNPAWTPKNTGLNNLSTGAGFCNHHILWFFYGDFIIDYTKVSHYTMLGITTYCWHNYQLMYDQLMFTTIMGFSWCHNS